MINQRLAAVIRHARQGTLTKRIKSEYQQRIRALICRNWDTYKRFKTCIDMAVAEGVTMRLYTDEVLSHLIYCRGFEYSEREFVSRFLRHGDTFVDIGANAGLYTLIASSIVGESGCVYAFEPSPSPFIHLMENISLNKLGNVKCIESALSDQTGKLLLNVSNDGHSAWDSFTLDQTTAPKETREVVTTTVDVFIEEEKLLGKVTMMKIDVEGWESKVLSGGGNTLSRPDAPLLQVEFVDTVAKSAGASCQDLYDMLRKYGYQLCTYDIELRQLVNEPKKQEYPYVNLFAVKDLDRVNRRLSGQKMTNRMLD